MRKRKKLTLDEAAKELADIIWQHIKHLPPAARRRRTQQAYNRIMARRKSNGHTDPGASA